MHKQLFQDMADSQEKGTQASPLIMCVYIYVYIYIYIAIAPAVFFHTSLVLHQATWEHKRCATMTAELSRGEVCPTRAQASHHSGAKPN